jgi:hypothetical protein
MRKLTGRMLINFVGVHIRVSKPRLIIHLTHTNIFEWCPVRYEPMKEDQKHMSLQEICYMLKFVDYSRFNGHHNWGGGGGV